MGKLRILYIEPFDGGSHRTFSRSLTEKVDADWTCLTLPGRYWKWRARGAAVYFHQAYSEVLAAEYDLLWAGSFLNLADLVALSPQLQEIPKVLYFHENQLAYPVRPEFLGARDNHFGISQMVSCLVADRCVFNSAWNRDSFLDEAAKLLKKMPDAKPPGWVEAIRTKSTVLPVHFSLPPAPDFAAPDMESHTRALGPIILWNHRWEFDKAPDVFFKALMQLKEKGVPFRLAVCGERYRRAPPIFEEARDSLGDRVVHWGYLESRDAYEDVLASAHIAVSTAQHEFFGISMIEAMHFGARPLVPNRLSYPEIFPDEYRYDSHGELLSTLEDLCLRWQSGEHLRGDLTRLTARYGAPLTERYGAFIDETANMYLPPPSRLE